ncbi:hypothetical protein OWV82_005538 [Melia azedarach]|uniref:Uncharacterized protein n=1 Tax=Melia azedarach TaxID=155640 RepID=A0ACC1YE71_MELAZ|nr:hypothetical protein OWV82_005538 [Melia azedarach]
MYGDVYILSGPVGPVTVRVHQYSPVAMPVRTRFPPPYNPFLLFAFSSTSHSLSSSSNYSPLSLSLSLCQKEKKIEEKTQVSSQRKNHAWEYKQQRREY